MKGGKRKKQPVNDTPFNEIISQMKNMNGKCIPCLIDFGGYSIYHCDTPLNPAKKQVDITNFSLSRYFNKWQKYIEYKSKRHYLDINGMDRLNTHVLSRCFKNWKEKYIQLSKANVIFYFTKWHLKFEDKILRGFLISHVGRRGFFAWRLVIHRSKTVGVYQKRKMKKYFLIMKKLYVGSTYRTKEFQKKCLLITSLSTKKKYFRKWFMKARNCQLLDKKEKLQTKSLEFRTRFIFNCWKRIYLFHVCIKRQANIIEKSSFDFWKRSKDVKQNFLNKKNEVQSFRNKQIIGKIINRWKRKYKIKRNKKRKLTVKLWSLVVYHMIIYAQIQQRNSYNIQLKIFSFMKKQTKKSLKETGRRILYRWQKIAHLQAAEKSVSQNYLKIKCETSLIKWRMKLHEIIDERTINTVRKEVVERNCILHCFRIWITKSMRIYQHKMKKVMKFRRRILLVFPFCAWKNVGRLKELRVQQYLKQKLMKKYFPAFKMYVNLSLKSKYEKVFSLYMHRIKKKYFNIMKTKLESSGFNYNYNYDDQNVVRLLNRGNNFLRVYRTEYI